MRLSQKVLLLANFLNTFGYALFSSLYAIFAQTINGNIFIIASSWGVYTITAGLMMLLCGKIEDSVQNKRRMVVLGYFILAIGSLSFLLVHSVAQLFAVQILNAVGLGILTPAWKTVYASIQDKGREAKEWSLYDGGNMILIGLGSFIGGYLILQYGFSSLFVIIFFIQLLAAIISLKLLFKN